MRRKQVWADERVAGQSGRWSRSSALASLSPERSDHTLAPIDSVTSSASQSCLASRSRSSSVSTGPHGAPTERAVTRRPCTQGGNNGRFSLVNRRSLPRVSHLGDSDGRGLMGADARYLGLLVAAALILAGCGKTDGRQRTLPTETSTPETHLLAPRTPIGSLSSSASAAFPPASQCPVLAPDELPDGAAPGAAVALPEGSREASAHEWGGARNRVIIGRGWEVAKDWAEDGGLRFPRSGEPVIGQDGVTRWVIAVGDPPHGEIAYRYVVDGCPYIAWTQWGQMTWDDVLAYAGRLATAPSSIADGTRVAINSHCGVISLTVDGQLWLADPPLGDHNPPAGWDDNETPGYFVLVDPRHGEFRGDGGQTAQFRRAAASTIDPGAGCE